MSRALGIFFCSFSFRRADFWISSFNTSRFSGLRCSSISTAMTSGDHFLFVRVSFLQIFLLDQVWAFSLSEGVYGKVLLTENSAIAFQNTFECPLGYPTLPKMLSIREAASADS